MKKLLSIILMMVVVGSVSAQNALFKVTSEKIKVKPGEQFTLSISLENDIDVVATQLGLYLPDGISVAETDDRRPKPMVILNNNRIDDHTANVTLDATDTNGDKNVLIAVFSPNNYPFYENAGELLSITFNVDENISCGEKSFEIKNIVHSYIDESQESQGVKQSDINVPLTIYQTFDISATTANEAMGSVTVEGAGAEVEGGTNVTATATPVAGYEFVNWTVGDEVVSTVNPYKFAASANVALVANFQAKKYDVSFVVDGTVTTESLAFGSKVNAPKDPVKEGHTFTGWSPAFVEGVTVPVDGLTYTATWKVNQYTITFNTDGGTEIGAITQDYGTEIKAPTNPTKTGYTFVAWDKNIPATMPAENLTIKATWTINQYDVVFDVDGQTSISNQDYGTAITAPEDPVKEGHTFAGWDPEFKEGATVPEGGITYTAKWIVNQYTITFDTDGGSEIAAITQDYGTEVTAPTNPTKTGYSFVAWDRDIPTTMPAEDLTIKATWAINQYDVVFDVDGQTSISNQDYGTVITAPETPVKEGHTFAGWDPEFKEGAIVPEGGITYTATWKVNQYTITFDTDGGSEIAAITQDYATEVAAPTNPTKIGYTFTAWEPEIPATMPANDLTVKATWTINQYTIKFVVDDEVVSETVLNYGSDIVAPADPEKEDFTFIGWDPEFQEGDKVPAEDVTYTAKWRPNESTITFDTDGGTEIAPITLGYGTEIEAPADPTKIGYTFAGWDPEIPETMPSNDITIKALWKANKYNVIFDVDGVQTITPMDYESVIEAPENPVKEGYTFAGWDPAFEEGVTVPLDGITYTATWTINQYTLNFDTDGGSEVESITQDYATEVTAPTNPTKTGYTFAGWDPEIPATMPAEDLTIKAQWTINQYTVRFVVDGEVISEEKQDYGSVIVAPENPAKDMHTFIGWSPEFVEGATMPAKNVTYTARWSANTDEIKRNLIQFLANIRLAEFDDTADEIIMQDVPYDYSEVKAAYSEAVVAIGLTDGNAIYAAYMRAQEELSEFVNYCKDNGNLQSFEYTLVDGWGTIILPFEYEAPENWTFYNVTGLQNDGSTLMIEQVESIESKTPYLVSGIKGTKVQFIGHVPAKAKNVTSGLLTGVLESNYTAQVGDYVLKNNNGEAAFHLVNENTIVNKAHCFLTLPETSGYPEIVYVESTTTSIESVGAQSENEIFNIAGQRQRTASRGINIINGKKVLVK